MQPRIGGGWIEKDGLGRCISASLDYQIQCGGRSRGPCTRSSYPHRIALAACLPFAFACPLSSPPCFARLPTKHARAAGPDRLSPDSHTLCLLHSILHHRCVSAARHFCCAAPLLCPARPPNYSSSSVDTRAPRPRASQEIPPCPVLYGAPWCPSIRALACTHTAGRPGMAGLALLLAAAGRAGFWRGVALAPPPQLRRRLDASMSPLGRLD